MVVVAVTTYGWLSLLFAALELLGVLTAVHAVLKARTVQASIAWAIALISFPLLALPLYWIFGRSRFHGYRRARRSRDRTVRARLEELKHDLARFPAQLDADPQDLKLLERLAGSPFTSGNEVRLLVNGQATFDAMFRAIDEAEHYLLVFFFIIADDRTGRALKERLERKARAGVRVYLGYDSFGSHKLPARYLDELRAAGVDAREFKTTRGRQNLFQLNFRNHRKIVVADGHTGLVGGLNVADSYAERWRDTHLMVRGPAVLEIQLTFAEDWNWATGDAPPDLDWSPRAADGDDKDVLILPSGPADEFETGALFFHRAIHAAEHRLWIATPYFVPDPGMVNALQLAALRGVDVRILMPERSDHRLIGLAARSFFDPVQKAGGRVFLYRETFMHQKIMLVDDKFATVGTANFTNRSFRLNFEITAIVLGGAFALEVQSMLRDDLERAVEAERVDLENKPFFYRLTVRIARLMSLEM